MAPKTSAPSKPKKSLQFNIQNNDIVCLILGILDEQKYYDTKRMLEKESRVYFSIEHIEQAVLKGDWEEVEKYVSAFIKLSDSLISILIFSLIRSHKFFEALERGDKSMALEILIKEPKFYAKIFHEKFNLMTQALVANNFRENPPYIDYGDINSERTKFLRILKKLIKSHPLLKDKLELPRVKSNILHALFKEVKAEDFLKKNSHMDECSNFIDLLLDDEMNEDLLLDSLMRELAEF